MSKTSHIPPFLLQLSLAKTSAEVSSIALEAVRTYCEADGATFVLREGELCHYADEKAISPLWKGSRFPLGSCISGWAMQFNETAVISDIERDDRIPKDAYRPTFVKSLCMVPVGNGQPVAAIGAYWKDEHLATREQIAILTALASTVYSALARVQSLESLASNIFVSLEDRELADDFSKLESALRTKTQCDDLLRKIGAKLVSRIPFSGIVYAQLDLLALLQSGIQNLIPFTFNKAPALVNGSPARLSSLLSILLKAEASQISLNVMDDFSFLTAELRGLTNLDRSELAQLIYLASTHYSTISISNDSNGAQVNFKFPVARGISFESPAIAPLLQGQRILLLTTELSSSNDLSTILNSHGAEVLLAQNNLTSFEQILKQKPTVALMYHKSESGPCTFAEVTKSLHLAVTENIPFVHVTDGSCSQNSKLENRKTIWLNSQAPTFSSTMVYSIAGIIALN